MPRVVLTFRVRADGDVEINGTPYGLKRGLFDREEFQRALLALGFPSPRNVEPGSSWSQVVDGDVTVTVWKVAAGSGPNTAVDRYVYREGDDVGDYEQKGWTYRHSLEMCPIVKDTYFVCPAVLAV